MNIKRTFQAIISLKQNDIPLSLIERDLELPIDSGHIITIPGVRRCGKSSLMELAIARLLTKGVKKQHILWISFDDERLRDITADDLDDILIGYREMYPDIDLKTTYMFFDEIQNIKDWELFVLRVYKSYCKNIFVSGSNASMLSEELSTALRGWPLEYEEFPLSFSEYCRFKNISIDKYSEQGQATLVNAFNEYLREGGYPEVVLSNNESIKSKLLQSYFNAMLFRDLIERYQLSNVQAVRYFIKRIMCNLSKPTSINAVYNDLKSQNIKATKERLYELADQCCSIYLLFRLSKYNRSFAKENQAQPKYFVVDNGLWRSVLVPQNEENGKLLENAVFLHLRRKLFPNKKLYFYSDKKECDFVVQEADTVQTLIQVSWSLSDPSTRRREIEGIVEAHKATGCTNLYILTNNEEEEIKVDNLSIHVMPVWRWMLM